MPTTLETISQLTEAEKHAMTRGQVRQQIGILVQQSAQRPAAIQRIKNQLAQPNVVAAFGDEYEAVVAAVETL